MQALVIIVNDPLEIDQLSIKFDENGFHGGTVFDSQGMGQVLSSHMGGTYRHLKQLLNNNRPYNKTFFLILNDDRVELAKSIVRDVINDLEEENKGIMFTIPISSVEGLTKE